MKKTILLIALAIITLLPLTFACSNSNNLVDLITDTCVDSSNHACDAGENPITSTDCTIGMDLNFIMNGWFIKIVLLILLIWLASKTNFFKDRNILILAVVIIFILYFASTGLLKTETPTTTTTTFPIMNLTTNATSTEFIVPQSAMSKAFTEIEGWGGKIWPSHPWLGWLIIIMLIILLIPTVTRIMDRVENFEKKNGL